jgi:hypothetical protein
MPARQLTFNGINGADGGYLLPPLVPRDLAAIVLGERHDRAHLQELADRIAVIHTLGPKEGVDPKDLAQSGWGIAFAAQDADRTPALLEALDELVSLRRQQAGPLFRIYQGADGVQPGESKSQFFARHGVGPGPADPERMPYYLLFVASPESIPFHFQYQADVQYAIGRIHFDTLDDYAHYARSVVLAESGQVVLGRRAAFFGPHSPDDLATQLSAQELVVPLAQQISQGQPGWQIETYAAQAASKAQLSRLLGGDQTPALLFSASHGMAFPTGHPRQLPDQGALLCQEWPGPLAWNREIPKAFYVAANDVPDDASLLGMIPFFFACYGAGTPRLDDFAHQATQQPVAIAPYAFLSRLPQRLLSHPNGGALAVVGHVDRAWGYSFLWPDAGAQLEVFRSTLQRLMEGHPIGSAIEYFNERYAELAANLTSELEAVKFGATPDDAALAAQWTAHNDARSYLVLGDPAVRLPLAAEDAQAVPTARPVLAPIELRPDPLAALEPPQLLALDLKTPHLLGLWTLAKLSTWDQLAFQNELRAAAGRAWWVVDAESRQGDKGQGDKEADADVWKPLMVAAHGRLLLIEQRLLAVQERFEVVLERWRAPAGSGAGLDGPQVETLRLLRATRGSRRRRSALAEQAMDDYLAAQRLLAQALGDPAWVELRQGATPLARAELRWGRAPQVVTKPAGQDKALETPLQQAIALVAATREVLRRVQALSVQLAQIAGDDSRRDGPLTALPLAYRFVVASLAQS